ncbi:MAG: hypothetical protein RIC14_08600 [Filomicrobium sp.]
MKFGSSIRSLSPAVCVVACLPFALHTSSAIAAAPLPHSIEVKASPEGAPVKCTMRATYDIAGVDVTFEVLARPAKSVVQFEMRTYTALVVRDIWLKTESLFTLGVFPPGRTNSIGTLVVKGQLEKDKARSLLSDLTDKGAEVSIVSGGTMPAARMAVDIPQPLPDLQATKFKTCWMRLL